METTEAIDSLILKLWGEVKEPFISEGVYVNFKDYIKRVIYPEYLESNTDIDFITWYHNRKTNK